MSKLIPQPQEIRTALASHLEPGEQLRYAAYSVQQSTLLVLLSFLGLLVPAALVNWVLVGTRAGLFGSLTFFLLWGVMLMPVMPLLRRDYLVGLTERRLLLQRIKTPVWTINLQATVSFTAYPLDQLATVQTQVGPLRVFICLPHSPLKLQCGGRGLNGNYQEAVALAQALQQLGTTPLVRGAS